jgi:hypothetical protein
MSNNVRYVPILIDLLTVEVKVDAVGTAINQKMEAFRRTRRRTSGNSSSYRRRLETLKRQHAAQESRLEALRTNSQSNAGYGAQLRGLYRDAQALQRRVNDISMAPSGR